MYGDVLRRSEAYLAKEMFLSHSHRLSVSSGECIVKGAGTRPRGRIPQAALARRTHLNISHGHTLAKPL